MQIERDDSQNKRFQGNQIFSSFWNVDVRYEQNIGLEQWKSFRQNGTYKKVCIVLLCTNHKAKDDKEEVCCSGYWSFETATSIAKVKKLSATEEY